MHDEAEHRIKNNLWWVIVSCCNDQLLEHTCVLDSFFPSAKHSDSRNCYVTVTWLKLTHLYKLWKCLYLCEVNIFQKFLKSLKLLPHVSGSRVFTQAFTVDITKRKTVLLFTKEQMAFRRLFVSCFFWFREEHLPQCSCVCCRLSQLRMFFPSVVQLSFFLGFFWRQNANRPQPLIGHQTGTWTHRWHPAPSLGGIGLPTELVHTPTDGWTPHMIKTEV